MRRHRVARRLDESIDVSYQIGHLPHVEDGVAPSIYVLKERDAISGTFVSWHEVPSAPISNRHEIAVRMRQNRRDRVAWLTGIDNPLIRDARDVIYNQQIEDAMGFMDEP